MRLYRAPSQILWRNDGWNECEAQDCEEALQKFRAMGMTIELANIQIGRGPSNWQFAETVPESQGGYDRGRHSSGSRR